MESSKNKESQKHGPHLASAAQAESNVGEPAQLAIMQVGSNQPLEHYHGGAVKRVLATLATA